MSTGFYYLDKSGEKIEIDSLEKAERKDHVTATRVKDQKQVTLSLIDEVEVE